jgi:hypothetical protein
MAFMKTKWSSSLLACALGWAVISCSRPMPASTPVAAVRHYPTIVRLESRHYSITISAGPRCPLYSIASSSGEMFVENISLGELHVSHPEFYNLLAPALAPEAAASAANSAPIFCADNQ